MALCLGARPRVPTTCLARGDFGSYLETPKPPGGGRLRVGGKTAFSAVETVGLLILYFCQEGNYFHPTVPVNWFKTSGESGKGCEVPCPKASK